MNTHPKRRDSHHVPAGQRLSIHLQPERGDSQPVPTAQTLRLRIQPERCDSHPPPPPQRGHLDIPTRGFSLGAVPASSRKPAGHTMQHERISENSLSAGSSCLLLPDRRHRNEVSRSTSPGCCNHAGGPRASPPRPVPQSSSRSDTAACLQSNRWRTRAIKPAPHNPLGPRRMAGGNPWPTLATEGCDGGPKCVSLPVYLANSMVY